MRAPESLELLSASRCAADALFGLRLTPLVT